MTVLIRNLATNQFEEKTREVSEIRTLGQEIEVVYASSNNRRKFRPEHVRIIRNPQRRVLAGGEWAEAFGSVWGTATEVVTFTSIDGAWSRIFYSTRAGEAYRTYPDDPLRPGYERLAFVHPESALNSFLSGSPIESRAQDVSPIFPFRCNLSQRDAVERALTHSISVIEGPPGTGKTETILNLIANIVAVAHKTVGVVSFGNAAVDNVRDKLDDLGFGHMVANLGRKEKREAFFAGQAVRDDQVAQFLVRTRDRPDQEQLANLEQQLAELDRRLRRLQRAERTRADRQQAVDAYRLEQRHFEEHLRRDELPDLEGLPLLRRSADRILDYLAETEMELEGMRQGPLRRLRNYFRYGSVRALDPADTGVVLALQRQFYAKRIGELERDIKQVNDELQRADFKQLSQQHQRLSTQVLSDKLAARYRGSRRARYQADSYRISKTFGEFIEDYPVVLSTCHSLPYSIANGYLLDYPARHRGRRPTAAAANRDRCRDRAHAACARLRLPAQSS